MWTKTQASFADGWKVFYQLRTVFAVLLILTMAVNIGVFITAKFTRLVLPQEASQPAATAAQPATAPTAQPSDVTPEMVRWRMIFRIAMDVTAVVAIVSVAFLVFCALLGVMMIVAGQLPGAGLASAAFFWAVLMVVLLLPWSNLLPQANCLPIGVPAFNDMRTNLLQSDPSFSVSQIDLWLRYVVYPLVVLLITILYLGRTSQANRQIIGAPTTQDVIQQIK